MPKRAFTILAIALVALAAAASRAAGADSAVVAGGDLKWTDMGIPGVASAPVSGDMSKGPSRFFLKYPAGFVSPKHHHTADHYVTLISGTMTLTVDGKEHRLGPGSYFALTGRASHVARVEGEEAAVMFIQADAAWDVVAEK
jgi:mannose-6-phosphate isomerase-like protein (cupin superfamily)